MQGTPDGEWSHMDSPPAFFGLNFIFPALAPFRIWYVYALL